MSRFHLPVLLSESVEGLAIRPDGVYVDVTFGGGGHTKAILERLSGGRVIAFDRDAEAVSNNPVNDPRLTLVNHSFRFMLNFLRWHKVLPVDGILADLGVSSHQIDAAHRGFSFRFNSRLDMRMDASGKLDAWEVVNRFSVERLEQILREYGEVPNARALSKAIARQRESLPIDTTGQLRSLAEAHTRGQSAQYLAKVFQALRIEVNGEMDALKTLISQAAQSLKPGGRLVIISYHSLEDRLVKNYFRNGSFSDEPNTDLFGNQALPFTPITKKPIIPTDQELQLNPRARSARMRIAEKTETHE